jgi:hypothetical protein
MTFIDTNNDIVRTRSANDFLMLITKRRRI